MSVNQKYWIGWVIPFLILLIVVLLEQDLIPQDLISLDGWEQ